MEEGSTNKGYMKTCDGTVLTVDELTKAIKNSIDYHNMEDEAARQMAMHILNFFGYTDRIIDNILEPEDRDAFYILEDSGLLTTEREETTLYDGREWRIHYWLFKKETIEKYIRCDASEKEEEDESVEVYDDIPDEIWSRPLEMFNEFE